jgi:hypothetical protein
MSKRNGQIDPKEKGIWPKEKVVGIQSKEKIERCSGNKKIINALNSDSPSQQSKP